MSFKALCHLIIRIVMFYAPLIRSPHMTLPCDKIYETFFCPTFRNRKYIYIYINHHLYMFNKRWSFAMFHALYGDRWVCLSIYLSVCLRCNCVREQWTFFSFEMFRMCNERCNLKNEISSHLYHSQNAYLFFIISLPIQMLLQYIAIRLNSFLFSTATKRRKMKKNALHTF